MKELLSRIASAWAAFFIFAELMILIGTSNGDVHPKEYPVAFLVFMGMAVTSCGWLNYRYELKERRSKSVQEGATSLKEMHTDEAALR